MMQHRGSLSPCRSAGFGSAVVMVTVRPSASMEEMPSMSRTAGCAASTASRLSFTAVPSMGRPSANVTPSRSRMRHVRLSGRSHDTASHGESSMSSV